MVRSNAQPLPRAGIGHWFFHAAQWGRKGGRQPLDWAKVVDKHVSVLRRPAVFQRILYFLSIYICIIYIYICISLLVVQNVIILSLSPSLSLSLLVFLFFFSIFSLAGIERVSCPCSPIHESSPFLSYVKFHLDIYISYQSTIYDIYI